MTGTTTATTAGVLPVTVAELAPANDAYQTYAAADLTAFAGDVSELGDDLHRGDLASARTDWLAAQTRWELVGASYDSFGDVGVAIDGLPDGLPLGVADPSFTGLHRLEYGLWHDQSAAQLLPVQARLLEDLAALRKSLTSDDVAGDPTNLPIRAHEILEDALRDHLSGLDDEGAGAAYPETEADVQVTRTVLAELRPLIATRAPALTMTLDADLTGLQNALTGARQHGAWAAPMLTPRSQRQAVDAAIGAALEDLSSVPDLLEVPPGA